MGEGNLLNLVTLRCFCHYWLIKPTWYVRDSIKQFQSPGGSSWKRKAATSLTFSGTHVRLFWLRWSLHRDFLEKGRVNAAERFPVSGRLLVFWFLRAATILIPKGMCKHKQSHLVFAFCGKTSQKGFSNVTSFMMQLWVNLVCYSLHMPWIEWEKGDM